MFHLIGATKPQNLNGSSELLYRVYILDVRRIYQTDHLSRLLLNSDMREKDVSPAVGELLA